MKIPKIAVISAIAFIVLLVIHSVLAQLYEEGIWRIIVPMLNALIAFTSVSFLLGKKWAYDYLKYYAGFAILINLIFNSGIFGRDGYGEFTTVMMVFYGIETLVCIVLLYSLLQSDTKKVFSQ